MRLNPTVLVRLTAYLAVVVTIFAVGIARLAPRKRTERRSGPAALAPVNIWTGILSDREGLLGLDPESGRLVHRVTAPLEHFDLMAGSPWRDSDSNAHAVGRWQRKTEVLDGFPIVESGLGRIALPSGEVISRVATHIPLSGPPCWEPSTRARLIYPAADGRLYRVDFDAADAKGIDPTPEPIEWAIPIPGLERGLLTAPVWPADPRFQGRLIVSIQILDRQGGEPQYQPQQFWLIQLDAAGHAIIDAAPVTQADPDRAKCAPVIIKQPDGTLSLAYLSRSSPGGQWRLKCVALIDHPTTGLPIADETRTETLAADCRQCGLAVSNDGEWLTYFPRATNGRVLARHIDLNAHTAESRQTRTAELKRRTASRATLSSDWVYPRFLGKLDKNEVVGFVPGLGRRPGVGWLGSSASPASRP